VNPFDQFDAPQGGNPFDRFSAPAQQADPKIGQPQDLTFAERYIAPILDKPIAFAKKDLRKFPAIGEPSAEKILLFNHRHPFLALESNGLRALLRLGFGEEKKSYSTTYRLVQKAAGEGLDKDYSWLIQAHLLLRRHGQELCRRSEPMCDKCPLAENCEYYQRGDV
jgi:endonuclease-3